MVGPSGILEAIGVEFSFLEVDMFYAVYSMHMPLRNIKNYQLSFQNTTDG